MSQCTTGPLGGGTSMSCSTRVKARVLPGAPDQLRGGELPEPAVPVTAQVFSVGSMSPSLKAVLCNTKPGVAVPLSIICGMATGLPAASGLADGLAAGLAAGFAAGDGLAGAAGLGAALAAGFIAGAVGAGAEVGVAGAALVQPTPNATHTSTRLVSRRIEILSGASVCGRTSAGACLRA